ncbi:hypothetical protein [Marinoscillum furvescens]|uniref:DUF5017 domain-containing protein n=1 Tax=Marinoscillum furvescens DSM 4134 TaxID=1122208 RepID=A0A3D9L3G6_MARFU|nr:hypothetical protein [Marinoscillum furvescens]RED97521.1 hypothetical protein C7460_112131 [Marinoscillum furvescens DSM 4134]
MKLINKFFIPVVIAALAIACNPLDETYEELEEQQAAEGSSVTVTYTMTSDDYGTVASNIRKAATTEDDSVAADFIEDHEAFSTEYEAKTYLPKFVNDNYPQFGKGTAVKVSYNFYQGDIGEVTAYSGAEVYYVSDADYESLGGEAATYKLFTAEQAPATYLPGFLAKNIQDPAEGDIALARYDYADEPNDPSMSFTFDKDAYQALVDHVKAEKGDNWIDSYGTAEYYYGAGAYYQNFEARVSKREEWIADNSLDDNLFEGLTTEAEKEAAIEARIAEGIGKYLEITYPNAVAEVNGVAMYYNVTYEIYDGSNETLYVRYQANGESPAKFELIDGPSDSEFASSSPSESRGSYFEYDGSKWELVENAYYLSSADYDAMGEGVGKYDNFSSSNPASDYLPALLMNKYPYGEEGESVFIGYKYFSGSTRVVVEEFVYTEGAWSNDSYTTMSDQYVHDGSSFIFDPSVSFKMVSADYQMIVDEVAKTKPDLVDSYGTGEFYYGAGAYYANFDLGYTSRWDGDYEQAEYVDLSKSERESLMITRMGEGKQLLLELKYSDASPVNGVDVFYTVTADSYDGTDGTWVTKFQVVGTGEFELIEGPTEQ